MVPRREHCTPEDSRSRRLFDDAFKVACALDAANEALTNATKPTRRMANRVRALEAKITPPKKRRAIEERRPLVSLYRNYIKAHGPPANLTGFIECLTSAGVLTVTRNGKDGKGRSRPRSKSAPGAQIPMSDRTARRVLSAVLGLTGHRGRQKTGAKSNTFCGVSTQKQISISRRCPHAAWTFCATSTRC
jgi:hypothetical protein